MLSWKLNVLQIPLDKRNLYKTWGADSGRDGSWWYYVEWLRYSVPSLYNMLKLQWGNRWEGGRGLIFHWEVFTELPGREGQGRKENEKKEHKINTKVTTHKSNAWGTPFMSLINFQRILWPFKFYKILWHPQQSKLVREALIICLFSIFFFVFCYFFQDGHHV